ncbi:phosphate butyryltransferase [Thalassobacillus hwangdonensis]|uniref:Phosphate butyryltransferase n=1 Tax=Thalassobacillus hwangdonensis TaxID=546108 RepID=A0ABW3KZV4_9BACI
MKSLQELVAKVEQNESKVVAIAQAADLEVMKAVKEAIERNLCHFLLVGNRKEMTEVAFEAELNLDHPSIELLSVPKEQVALEAVKAVKSGVAHVVMKGNIATKDLLKAVLHKEFGLRTGNVLSHVALFEIPAQEKLLFLTDAAMNITPGIEEKVQIVQNAVKVARGLGIEVPKVAPLAAVEVVNPAMSASTDAALLTQMNRRGQIRDCIIDGPLAFDNAVSKEAAEHKGIDSPVAGEADILVVPAIEVANALYKSFMYFAGAKVAGVISGAASPIVLTSRSDSAESKIYSLALALFTSEK